MNNIKCGENDIKIGDVNPILVRKTSIPNTEYVDYTCRFILNDNELDIIAKNNEIWVSQLSTNGEFVPIKVDVSDSMHLPVTNNMMNLKVKIPFILLLKSIFSFGLIKVDISYIGKIFDVKIGDETK